MSHFAKLGIAALVYSTLLLFGSANASAQANSQNTIPQDFGLTNPNSWDDSTAAPAAQASPQQDSSTTTLPTITVSAPRYHAPAPEQIPAVQLQPVNVDSLSAPNVSFPNSQASGNPYLNQSAKNTNSNETSGFQGSGDASQTAGVSQSANQSNQCNTDEDIARKCCLHPEQCMGSTSNANPNDNASVGMQIFASIMAAGAQIPSASAAEMCGRMKDISTAMGAVDLYLANQCRAAVSQCDSACRGSKDDIALCEKYSGTETSLAGSAISSQLGSQLLSQCQNLANQQTNQFATPDCTTAAAASTPFCQYACNRPNAQLDPNCAGILANMQNNGGLGQGLNTFGAGTNSSNPFANSLPTTTDPTQTPTMANIPPGQNPSLDTPSAGGGGAQLPGGGGGSGGFSPARAPAQQSGWDANILKGIASGNGYTGASGGPHTGYNSGYTGASNSPKTNLFGKPFNLKDFLPGGGKSGVRLNAFRGLASTYADISPAHVDIFKKISDRFRAVCMRDALYDCSTIIKMRPNSLGH